MKICSISGVSNRVLQASLAVASVQVRMLSPREKVVLQETEDRVLARDHESLLDLSLDLKTAIELGDLRLEFNPRAVEILRASVLQAERGIQLKFHRDNIPGDSGPSRLGPELKDTCSFKPKSRADFPEDSVPNEMRVRIIRSEYNLEPGTSEAFWRADLQAEDHPRLEIEMNYRFQDPSGPTRVSVGRFIYVTGLHAPTGELGYSIFKPARVALRSRFSAVR